MIDTFIIVMPLMLSPGPANLVTFALAARFGFTRVIAFKLGIIVVYFCMAVILGLLTKEIAGHAKYGLVALQLLGGLFIAYLGLRLATRKQRGATDVSAPEFSKGMLFQILNPKYPAVVLTVVANRADESTVITAGIITIVGATGLLIHSLAGAIVCNLSPSEKWSRCLDVGFGVLLCLVGIWIAVKPFLLV
jgi:threonine/homoserine/homoserine lactone efflux protein